jgi:hypothetical protein
MPVAFTKSSGVIILTGTGQPIYFFGTPKGSFTANSDNITINMIIEGKPVQVVYTDLRVNGTTPSTINTALTLLNSFFGS